MRREMIRGVMWSGAASWTGTLISLAAFAITARILGPEAFGLIALAGVLVSIPYVFLHKTSVETLIQAGEPTEELLSSAFWAVFGIGILSSVVLAGLSGFIAPTFDHPTLAFVLPVYSFTLVPMALKVVPSALLKRKLRFADVAAGETLGVASAAIVSVSLALAGAGVWSLVASAFAHFSVSAFFVWRASGWGPNFKFELKALKELRMVSAKLFAADLISVAIQQSQRMIVVGFLGLEALGYFVFAWNLFERLRLLVIGPIDSVALPAITRMRDNVEQARPIFRRALEFSAVLTFPIFLGAAAVATIAVPVVFGEKWIDARVVVALTMLIGLRSAVTGLNAAVLKGLGRSGLHLGVSASNLTLTVVLGLIAAPFGLEAFVISVLVRSLISWPLSAVFVRKAFGLPMKDQITPGAHAFLASLGMAAIVLVISHAMPSGVSDGATLVLMVIGGMIAYPLLLLALCRRDERALYLSMVRRAVKGDFGGIKQLL